MTREFLLRDEDTDRYEFTFNDNSDSDELVESDSSTEYSTPKAENRKIYFYSFTL